MTVESVLATVTLTLVPFSWFSALVLGHAAYKRPRIGALTERAVIAVAIAVMITLGALLVLNRGAQYSFFNVEVARAIFTLSLLVIGAVPVAWTVLWLLGRLGENQP